MKTIGKYQILSQLGSSATGTTYRVRVGSIGVDMALKVLASSATLTADLKDEFCRDLTAFGELQHPHLVKVRDVGEVDSAIYVVTGLLSGVDLRTHLDEQRVILLPRKLELMAQVCDGLAAAHSKGIAHGNIKPSNIFIAGADAQILDFGSGRWLCLILEAGARPENLFPNYFAPEQILGEPFDARSDVFSTALVLHEWLTGKYPFQVPASILPREIVHTELGSVRKAAPEIPETLDALICRGLKKNREQRVQTAAEFANGLRRVIRELEGGPATVETPSPAAIPTPPLAPPPAAVKPGSPDLLRRVLIYSIAAVLVLFAVLALLARQSMRASQNNKPNAAASTRRIEKLTPANSAPQAESIVPEAQPAAAGPSPAQRAADAPPIPAVDETALLRQVNSAWEAGAYARAMHLVNQILTSNPDNAAARSWKKKIRTAQLAEESMK
jgi:serine/threonine protein kinase